MPGAMMPTYKKVNYNPGANPYNSDWGADGWGKTTNLPDINTWLKGGSLSASSLQPRLQNWNRSNPMAGGIGPRAGQWGAVNPGGAQVGGYMANVMGQQRNMTDHYAKQMAQAGINRNARGMGVAGGSPLDTALAQQNIQGLASGVGQNFRDAMGAAQQDWKMVSDAMAAKRADQVRMLGIEQQGEASRWGAEAQLRDWQAKLLGLQSNQATDLARLRYDSEAARLKAKADWDAMVAQNRWQDERDYTNLTNAALTKANDYDQRSYDERERARIPQHMAMMAQKNTNAPNWLKDWETDRWNNYGAFAGMGFNPINPGGGGK